MGDLETSTSSAPMAEGLPTVSVIMPVYNSEGYVEHAVRSILNQSYQDFELILVDDGSRDSSGNICDALAAEDGRIVVIHKENGGICSARNAGLARARGTYLAFCDNDDEYLPGLLEDNVTLAQSSGADMVRYLREHLITLNGEVLRREVLGEGRPALCVTDETVATQFYELMQYGRGVWSALYKRDVVLDGKLEFPEEMKYGFEDEYFNSLFLKASANVVVNPKVYYRWSERYAHSTSRKFSTNRLDAIKMCMRLGDEVNVKYGISERDGGLWAAYLVDTYVIRMLQQLTLPICDLERAEKRRQLRLLAEEPVLGNYLPLLPLSRKDVSWKTRLIALLLRHRAYGTLIMLFGANAKASKRVY